MSTITSAEPVRSTFELDVSFADKVDEFLEHSASDISGRGYNGHEVAPKHGEIYGELVSFFSSLVSDRELLKFLGILWYNPNTLRPPHFDNDGTVMLATLSGGGTYTQYPRTDAVLDAIALEQQIPVGPDYEIEVTPGDLLITNSTIPHAFSAGESGRTGVYAAIQPKHWSLP